MHRFVRTLRLLTLLGGLALLVLASPAGAAPAGTTLLVSRPDGTGLFSPPKDGSVDASAPLAVSDTGRYVAFVSNAPFDPAARPGVENVYLRDTLTGTTTLVSRSDGLSGAGADADSGVGDIAHEGDTVSIAVQPFGATGDAPHNKPHVLVAFSTTATNLVDHTDHAVEHGGGLLMVWMRDVTAGTTYLVSRADGLTGDAADAASFQPSIAASPGGPLVAYTSEANNLYTVWGQIPTMREVYLREVGTGASHVVSCPFQLCNGDRPPQGTAQQPSLRVVSGSTGDTMCDSGQTCAVVAFTSSDPTMFLLFSSVPNAQQVVAARAVEQPDGRLAPFGDFQVASTGGSSPPMLAATGASDPQLTADGRGVVFRSDATNLVPNPFPGPLGVEAYFAWLGGSAFEIASVGRSKPGAPLALPDAPVAHVSVGGTFVSPRFGMDTAASNWGAPPVGPPSVVEQRAYAEDPTAAQTLLDHAADGTPGDKVSGATEISADGSTAVFYSASTNLGAGGGSEFIRVYRRVIDPNAPGYGTLQLVSRPSGTGPFPQGDTMSSITHQAVSADGRYVAFQTTDADLVPQNSGGPVVQHVFVRDTVNGTTTLVDRASGASGVVADHGATLNAISDDGHRVMFTSGSHNLCSGCDAGSYVYVRDLSAQTTILVSRDNGATGSPVGASSSGQSLSGDGNRATFATLTPLDPRAFNGFAHLYVRDIGQATTTLADRDDGVKGAAASGSPIDASLNHDGSKVAWTTDAILSMVPFKSPAPLNVFVRDLNAGTTVVASRANGAAGAVGNADSDNAVIDAAGDAVAFESDATNLGPVGHRSIWVRRLATNQTLLVSRASGANGAPADDNAFEPSIDAAGDKVAFMTHADNLGAIPVGQEGTINGLEAYVRSLNANATDLVSRVNGINGERADPAGGGAVSIAPNGGCVAFSSTGANFNDLLASAIYPAVRERVLTSNCGGASGALVDGSPPGGGLNAPATLSRLLASPARFFVGAHGGTRLSFALSAASTVTLSFDRLGPGRARGARCLAGARTGRPCTLARLAGRLRIRGHAGVNRVRFSGRIGRRALAPGRYRWTATPLHGHGRSNRFTVVSAPARQSARHVR